MFKAFLLAETAFALLAAILAYYKRSSVIVWSIIGFLFGPAAVLLLLLINNRDV